MFGQTVTASADTMAPGPQRALRLATISGWRWTSSARPAAASCRSARASRSSTSTPSSGASASSCSCSCRTLGASSSPPTTRTARPFTTYPHLIRLLMDRSFRHDMLAKLPKAARAMSTLGFNRARVHARRDRDHHPRRPGPHIFLGIDREHGHLGPGAAADVDGLRGRRGPRAHVRAAAAAAEERAGGDARRGRS